MGPGIDWFNFASARIDLLETEGILSRFGWLLLHSKCEFANSFSFIPVHKNPQSRHSNEYEPS